MITPARVPTVGIVGQLDSGKDGILIVSQQRCTLLHMMTPVCALRWAVLLFVKSGATPQQGAAYLKDEADSTGQGPRAS